MCTYVIIKSRCSIENIIDRRIIYNNPSTYFWFILFINLKGTIKIHIIWQNSLGNDTLSFGRRKSSQKNTKSIHSTNILCFFQNIHNTKWKKSLKNMFLTWQQLVWWLMIRLFICLHRQRNVVVILLYNLGECTKQMSKMLGKLEFSSIWVEI